jgi:hypothetical protein
MPKRKPLTVPGIAPADSNAFLKGEPSSAAPQATPEEARVRFTVDLPKTLHKRLKQAAVDREKPMTDLARDALAEWLDSQS